MPTCNLDDHYSIVITCTGKSRFLPCFVIPIETGRLTCMQHGSPGDTLLSLRTQGAWHLVFERPAEQTTELQVK